jgi:hypothetical protein
MAKDAVARVLAELGRAPAVLAEGGCPLLAEAIQDWRSAPAPVALEAALGLPLGWRLAECYRFRDATLRRLAAEMRPGSNRDRARWLYAELHRYRIGEFSEHRNAGTRPDGRARLLYDVLTAVPGHAPRIEQLRKIIAAAGLFDGDHGNPFSSTDAADTDSETA